MSVRRKQKDAYTHALLRWMLSGFTPTPVKPQPKHNHPYTRQSLKLQQTPLVQLQPKIAPIKLRSYQQQALQEFLKMKKCTLEMASATGKTFVAVKAIKRLGKSTVIVVPTIAILKTVWLRRLREAGLGAQTGVFYGEKKQLTPILITTYQSLDYDEPILVRDNGLIRLVKIGKFIDKYYPSEEYGIPKKLNNGLEVLSFSPHYKIEWKPLSYVYRDMSPKHIYKVSLETGREVKLTESHSIYILDPVRGVVTKPTSKLKIGDYVVIPKRLPPTRQVETIDLIATLSSLPPKLTRTIEVWGIPKSFYEINRKILLQKLSHWRFYDSRRQRKLPLSLLLKLGKNVCANQLTLTSKRSPARVPTHIPFDEDFGRLLGYYVSDGSLGTAQVNFFFGDNEQNLVDDVIRISQKLFNIKPFTYKSGKERVVSISGRVVSLLIRGLIGDKKRIPQIILNTPPQIQQAFIAGFNKGDDGSSTDPSIINSLMYLHLFSGSIASCTRWFAKDVEFPDGHTVKSSLCYSIQTPDPKGKRRSRQYWENIPIEYALNIIEPIAKFGTKHFASLRQGNRRGLNKYNWQKLFLNRKRYSRRIFALSSLRNDVKKAERFCERFGLQHGLVERVERGKYKLTEKALKTLEGLEDFSKLLEGDLAFVKVTDIKTVKPSTRFVYDVSVKDWENFVGGWGGVICHNSMVRYPRILLKYAFIIFDEAHHLKPEKWGKLLEYAKHAEYALALTATLGQRWDEKTRKITQVLPVAFTYKIYEARQEGWVAPIEVYSHPVEMTPHEAAEYREYTEVIRKVAWQLHTSDPTVWSKLAKRGDRTARKGLWAISKRRTLLSNIQAKLPETLEIIEDNLDSRTLLFSESISSIRKLKDYLTSNGIKCATYHSKMSKAEKEYVLRTGWGTQFQTLLSVRCLDEGLDVPDASVGIIHCSGRTPRQIVQRLGRVLRTKPGKTARVYVVWASGTIESKVLEAVKRAVFKVK